MVNKDFFQEEFYDTVLHTSMLQNIDLLLLVWCLIIRNFMPKRRKKQKKKENLSFSCLRHFVSSQVHSLRGLIKDFFCFSLRILLTDVLTSDVGRVKIPWADFNSGMRELMKIANCPICFVRMQADVVSCLNGHVFCGNCGMKMHECPTCRASFANVGKTFITQLLLALPYVCENDGCEEVSFDRARLENHEMLCSHRVTNCKICPWKGKLKDLMAHVVEAAHQMGNSETDTELEIRNISETKFHRAVLYSEYYEQFFWRVLSDNSTKLTLQYICVPNEKAENCYFKVKIVFQSEECKLLMEKKLVLKDELLGATLIFDKQMLHQFIVAKKLKYKFCITMYEEEKITAG